MDAPECRACQRSFTSQESLNQHLSYSTIHNPRRRPRGGRRNNANPRSQLEPPRHETSPHHEPPPQHGHEDHHNHVPLRGPRSDTSWLEHVEMENWLPQHPVEDEFDMFAAMTGADVWCCTLCEREFASERSLQQHMNDSTAHAVLLQAHIDSLVEGGLSETGPIFRAPVPESPGTPTADRLRRYMGWTVSWEPEEDYGSPALVHISGWPFQGSTGELTPVSDAPPNIETRPAEGDDMPPLPPPRAPTPDQPAEPNFDHLGDLSLEDQVKKLKEMVREAHTALFEEKATLKRERTLRQCSMCYEKPTDTVTKCGHQFCSTCVGSWQRQQNRFQPYQTPCPMCRAPMGKPIKMYAE